MTNEEVNLMKTLREKKSFEDLKLEKELEKKLEAIKNFKTYTGKDGKVYKTMGTEELRFLKELKERREAEDKSDLKILEAKYAEIKNKGKYSVDKKEKFSASSMSAEEVKLLKKL